MKPTDPSYDLQARRWRQGGRFVPAKRARRKADRLGRAIELAAIGNVIAAGDGWTVVSADGAHFYNTTTSGCDCPDALYRGSLCKHQLAAALASRTFGALMLEHGRQQED